MNSSASIESGQAPVAAAAGVRFSAPNAECESMDRLTPDARAGRGRAMMLPAVQSETADVPAAPVVCRGVVARCPLFGRLRDAGRVVQVSAPAGSGKTVLLRSWICATGMTDNAAWVPVQCHERDPRQFWISLIDALRGTTAGSKLIRPLTAAPELNGWAAVERLLEDLSQLRDRLWLVIDDLDELHSPEARRQLELLLLRAPQELRFVLATRRDLPLGLHRLRLEGELTDIRAADLRFTLEEARTLLDAAGATQMHTAVPAPRLAEADGVLSPLPSRSARGPRDRQQYPEEPLTDGEIRVLHYLPTHLTAPEIARQLYLSVHTVTTHIRHIYAKLGVHRRREAVDRARARGLLQPVPVRA